MPNKPPPKVFIPSLPARSVDLSAAREYGHVVTIVAGEVRMPEDLVAVAETPIGPRDYIVAVGDVVLVAAAITHACRRNESARVLRWDRKRQTYDTVEVKL